jgi:hypothetical protein
VERLYANAEAEIDAEEDDTLNESEVYESELLPVLGTCRALYAFEGSFHPAFPIFEKRALLSPENLLVSFHFCACTLAFFGGIVYWLWPYLMRLLLF